MTEDSAHPSRSLTLMPLVVILLAYALGGGFYAYYTPPWQAPDEPAHYNYIRALAEERHLPVMEIGDYDQAYLSTLTSRGFPPDLSVAPLTYEDHQPPLYYLLAVPIYLAAGGSILALRLFSLTLGGLSITALYLLLREMWPTEPWLPALGAASVATIPQFLAIMASINNDALTLALLWLWLWVTVRYFKGSAHPALVGCIGGTLLLTKTTGYSVLPLAILALWLRWRHMRQGSNARAVWREALMLLGLPLAMGSLWWIRNTLVYGWPDILGLQRHTAVVVGQPRTADWIADMGLRTFLTGALRTTFQSFWGQFGWMGVVLDQRIYLGFLMVTLFVTWAALWGVFIEKRDRLALFAQDALVLLLGLAGLTIIMYVTYNLTFVQHQGRYLFPALPLYAVVAGFGLTRLGQRRFALATGIMFLGATGLLVLLGILRHDLPMWPIAIAGAAGGTGIAVSALPDRWRRYVGLVPLVLMWGVDLWCLFGFIVPLLKG